MKKAFCDNCGKEVGIVRGITMVEVRTAFWVKEKSMASSARETNLDFCDELCFGRGMEKWIERQMQNHRDAK